MDFNIVSKLIDPVKDIVVGAMDKIAGDKVDEETKIKLETTKAEIMERLEQEAKEKMEQEMQNYRTFVLKYEGAAEDVPKFITVIRSLIRPIITIAVVGAYGYGFLNPLEFDKDQLSMLYPLTVICLSFWFGERMINKTGLMDVFKEIAKKQPK